MTETEREVRKVIGAFEMWDGRRAREVVAVYEDGDPKHEIEVAVDEEYQLRFREVDE